MTAVMSLQYIRKGKRPLSSQST